METSNGRYVHLPRSYSLAIDTSTGAVAFSSEIDCPAKPVAADGMIALPHVSSGAMDGMDRQVAMHQGSYKRDGALQDVQGMQ